jgi:hypothetical protein
MLGERVRSTVSLSPNSEAVSKMKQAYEEYRKSTKLKDKRNSNSADKLRFKREEEKVEEMEKVIEGREEDKSEEWEDAGEYDGGMGFRYSRLEKGSQNFNSRSITQKISSNKNKGHQTPTSSSPKNFTPYINLSHSKEAQAIVENSCLNASQSMNHFSLKRTSEDFLEELRHKSGQRSQTTRRLIRKIQHESNKSRQSKYDISASMPALLQKNKNSVSCDVFNQQFSDSEEDENQDNEQTKRKLEFEGVSAKAKNK